METGLSLIIIDYLQLMNVHRQTERRDLDISEISRSLKGLAKELNIPVVALSQLNRQLRKKGTTSVRGCRTLENQVPLNRTRTLLRSFIGPKFSKRKG